MPFSLAVDSGFTYRRDQDSVAGLHTHGQPLAILVQTARANSQNLGLVQLLDTRLGQEDAGGGLGLCLDAVDQDTVQEGYERLDRSDGGGLLRGEKSGDVSRWLSSI